MKQIHNMQIAKSFSPDESPDLIPRSKKPEPITDPAQLPMALNAAQVAATLGISRAGSVQSDALGRFSDAVHRQAHGGAEGQVAGLDERPGQIVDRL